MSDHKTTHIWAVQTELSGLFLNSWSWKKTFWQYVSEWEEESVDKYDCILWYELIKYLGLEKNVAILR